MVTFLQILPLFLVTSFFLILPIITIFVVSFWEYTEYSLVPDFVLTNYLDVFNSVVTYKTYLNTLWYALITWFLTLIIGFTIALYLSFHVKKIKWQIFLFLICTIPFWTSNIIRMISWIPFLGRNGIINKILLNIGIIDKPLDFLLFSDFSIILAFTHLYSLFMIVPIFNSMNRIDRSLIEAAVDCGSYSFAVIWHIIIPLCKPGIAIGSIFVITLVMGDYITVRLMGGGQRASVGVMMWNEISLLLYPPASAHAIVLLLIVLAIVSLITRYIDIKKEL